MAGAFDLNRFIEAQAPVYTQVQGELQRGRKTTHWMWFIFPQAAGLGQSPTAVRYAIGSSGEARAYLAHPLLGVRLKECAALVFDIEGRTLHEIFGSPDDLKFCSSMTLFAAIAPGEAIFAAALRKYHTSADARTVEILERGF
jgi:uncharacterized protein (DUF1810 family)